MIRHLLVLTAALLLAATAFAQTSGAPTIASLSNSQTLTEGTNLTLSVSVNGTAPFSYQWRKAGTAIPAATNSTLAFTPLRAADAGSYTVVVTNTVGTVTSGPVVLAVNPAVAPSFYYQPSSASFLVGSTLQLSASVSGTSPLTFVWKRGTTVVETSTSSYFSKANAQTSDAGTYTVTVSNIAGSVTSSPISVTVNALTPPTFSYNLSDATVATGESLWLYASVNGGGTITYQWKKDGVPITGANYYSFSKSNLQAADAGSYTLTATNEAGSVASNAAKVTVLPPVAPTINSISGAVSVVVGDSFSLSVSASGTRPFTYQWRKDGQPIAGATSSYYSKSAVQIADAGAYSVVVGNAQGSATSSAVPVAVTNARPPVITYHPPSMAVQLGAYLYSLSVGASGSGTLSYQWSKNGSPIAGATGSSLYYNRQVTAADAGTYTVVVSSTLGSVTSEPAYITILPATAPVIVRQPASRAIRQGETLELDVYVNATPSAAFQWRKDGVVIAGATNASYYKNNVASSDAGAYSVVATNSAGSATSESATVTVIAAAAPKIVSHPASASLLPGQYFYGMFVEARPSNGATVQWYRDGVAVPNATSTSFYIGDAQPSMAGTYTAVVTNSAGSVTSREAVITVDANTTRPVITYVQGSRSIAGGSNATLQVATSSSGETVQWFKDGLIIPNATEKEYSFSKFALGSAGTYTAQVSTTLGTFTSRAIVLELLDAGEAPVITRQPVSLKAQSNWSTSFSVDVTGELPLSYQWRKDGVNIPGATSREYHVSSPTTAHAGAYSVVVSNRNGSATSSAATLTVDSGATSAPVIVRHPYSQTRTQGSGSIELSVEVQDSFGVSYQWRKDGAAISGATSYYYYASSTAASAGRYSVVVTNTAGSVTSYDAVVAITSSVTGPTFTLQPQNIEAYFGNSVTFTSTATGTAPVTYQWRKNGTAIGGATNSSLTLNNVQSADAAAYTVVATDANGSTPSVGVTLSLSGGVTPFIIANPASASALAGTATTFTVAVGGTPAPGVQWRRDGVDIPGATALSLSILEVQASDAGSYTVVARNPVGTATSAPAVLTVVFSPPTITTQPANVSVEPGAAATFTVVAKAEPSPTYQWRKDGVAIAGATTSTLSFTNVQASQAGRYAVTISTSFGAVTSVDALLTVGSPVTAQVSKAVTAKAGVTVTLTASIQAKEPLLFRWARNGVPIAGATSSSLLLPAVQPAHAGTYSLEIRRADGTVVYPLTGSAALTTILSVELPELPVITQQPVGARVPVGAQVTLVVRAQSSGPITYQWQKNGMPIPDAFSDTLVLSNVQPSDAADYRAVAMGINGSTASAIARVEVTGSPFAGTYFGTFPNSDSWALHVKEDGTGVFIALLSTRGQVIVARDVTVQPSGAFSFGHAQAVAAYDGAAFGVRYYSGMVSGQIAGGAVTGGIPGANLLLAGQRAGTAPGGGAMAAGHFEAVPVASDLGHVDVIAASDGTIVLVAVDSAGVRGGRGNVTADGLFAITQPQYAYHGTLAASAGQIRGTYTPLGGTAVMITTPATATSSERLMNVATRGLAGGGAQTLTAGFVISGSAGKDVLIRAVGPGLTQFGVAGVLVNPRLRIFKDGTPVLENDDWAFGGFATQIAQASARVGAFELPNGSADAALMARLEPGAYTAQISADGNATGVALVEVYDTTSATAGAPKLVNLSTRGSVGRDGDILIVGVVVSGTSAKQLLIRGIGPALADFNVEGALADPKLALYQGNTLVRENDNWSSTSDAGALAATATAVGAFPLPSGSKDAALLVYLTPGNYTAQISGVNATTGVALVEVYEVP